MLRMYTNMHVVPGNKLSDGHHESCKLLSMPKVDVQLVIGSAEGHQVIES